MVIGLVLGGLALGVVGVAVGMDLGGRLARAETLREVAIHLRQRAVEETLYGGDERGWPYREAAGRIESWTPPELRRGENRRKVVANVR